MNPLLWLVAGILPGLLALAACGVPFTGQLANEVTNIEEAFVRVEGMTRRNGIL
jgi:hypothetical protein